jgi:hypothetical protein
VLSTSRSGNLWNVGWEFFGIGKPFPGTLGVAILASSRKYRLNVDNALFDKILTSP